jgi:hypothetical protein
LSLKIWVYNFTLNEKNHFTFFIVFFMSK